MISYPNYLKSLCFFNYYKLIIFFYLLYLFSCEYHQLYSLNEDRYRKIKRISSEEYLIILRDGIYIYNKDFSIKSQKYKFTGNQIIDDFDSEIDKISISELRGNNNFYVLCLVKNYIFIYNYNISNIKYFTLDNKIDGSYYNLIPIKAINNKLEYIITFIKHNNYGNYNLNFFHYKINLTDNINILYQHNIFKGELEPYISDIYLSCNIIKEELLTCIYIINNSKNLAISSFNIEKNFTIENEYENYILRDAIDKIKHIKCILKNDSNEIFCCFDGNYNVDTGKLLIVLNLIITIIIIINASIII